MYIRVLATIIFLVFASGCAAEAETIEEAIEDSSCIDPETNPPKTNIFNARSAICSSGGRLYWFPTAEAKDNHAELCKQFGGKSIEEGANWAWYSPSC